MAVIVQSWWVLAANVLWIVIHAFLCREVAKTGVGKRREIIRARPDRIGGTPCLR